MARVPATLAVCIPMAVISTLLFGTTTGLPVLDVLDKFINVYGIVAAGFMYVLALVVWEKLPLLRKTRQFRFLFQNRRCLELLHPHHA